MNERTKTTAAVLGSLAVAAYLIAPRPQPVPIGKQMPKAVATPLSEIYCEVGSQKYPKIEVKEVGLTGFVEISSPYPKLLAEARRQTHIPEAVKVCKEAKRLDG